jgi:hypothetical protein
MRVYGSNITHHAHSLSLPVQLYATHNVDFVAIAKYKFSSRILRVTGVVSERRSTVRISLPRVTEDRRPYDTAAGMPKSLIMDGT